MTILRFVMVVGIGALLLAPTAEAKKPPKPHDHPKPADPPVTLCHVPKGNPANAHTIVVGGPAVKGHLGHGDALGPCGGGNSGSDGT